MITLVNLEIECLKCKTFLHFEGKPTPEIATFMCSECKFLINVHYKDEETGE